MHQEVKAQGKKWVGSDPTFFGVKPHTFADYFTLFRRIKTKAPNESSEHVESSRTTSLPPPWWPILPNRWRFPAPVAAAPAQVEEAPAQVAAPAEDEEAPAQVAAVPSDKGGTAPRARSQRGGPVESRDSKQRNPICTWGGPGIRVGRRPRAPSSERSGHACPGSVCFYSVP